MSLKLLGKISAAIFVVMLILMNFYGLNFGITPEAARAGDKQPYNSFKQYICGGVGEGEDSNYGWNITYIENLNGDNYPDLVVGTPWYDGTFSTDVGKIYIFFGSPNSGLSDINCSNADVTISGDAEGNKFGWDIADAGDVNNDGINDLIVGAPGALDNRGRVYIFFGGNIPSGSFTAMEQADRSFDGLTADGYYGAAVTGVGDINNDGHDEVLVGAPRADQAVISYGYKDKITFYPNIWDDNATSKGIITFDNGVNNTVNDLNTWGLDGDDDGWDWIDSFHDTTQLYGQTTGASYDHANIYAPWEDDGPDADGLTLNNRTALEIMIGRNHTDYNPYGGSTGYDPGASAAWGIEFNITNEMFDYISSNSTITVSFDYEVTDTNNIYGSPNTTWEISTIRSRIWNSSDNADKYYIGNDSRYGDKYIFYYSGSGLPPWGPFYGSFKYDITDYIDHAGSFYWDFGCYLDRGFFTSNCGMMALFDNIGMEITNVKNSILQGISGSGFGSSVAGIGDINEDGLPDMVIGAPNLDGGHVAMIHGKKRFNTIESENIANVILTGRNNSDKFGKSVSYAGDVDNDNIPDIIIGAPGGNYANLYFGKTLNTPAFIPDMWENIQEQETPQVEFNSAPRSTGNTPGISGDNDGWDTWDGVYGSTGTAGSSTKYNGFDNINTEQIADDDELIISIGGPYGNSARPDSGAYGIEFQITSEMIQAIEAGGGAVISYNWDYENKFLYGQKIWIRNYIRNNKDNFDLGWEFDGNNEEKEVYWSNNPLYHSDNDIFIQDCSECFQNADWFYFDIGGKVETWSTSDRGAIFHFDNIHLRINHPPDIKFIGEDNTSFGASVGYCDKLNHDDYGDIVIGAPCFDSPNGIDSGAIYGFFTRLNNNLILANNSEFITFGENPGDNLGWSLFGVGSLDSDDYSEVVTSAINFDSTSNKGKIYIYSITKSPRIRLLYPVGGETLNGNITLNATIIDPDDNVDNNYGVRFLYSTDLIKWNSIGKDKTPFSTANIYDHYWNTTLIPDSSNYYVKAWVRDLELNIGENISSAVTINNPHPPKISFNSPQIGEVIKGSYQIKVLAKDSELDIIGGGINTTEGVNFYFSSDQSAWGLLKSVNSSVNDVYMVMLESEEYPDGEYWLKVNATDLDGFQAEKTVNFTIDNPARTPQLKLLFPTGAQELAGEAQVRATAFDLDGDINSSGVTFYISTDGNATEKDWQHIGKVPEPEINETGAPIYSMIWDTTTVDDNWYYLKAFVRDLENFTNESISPEIKVHNNIENPPFIKLITPQAGEKLEETKIIMAHVRDLEDNIDSHGVDYFYSKDKIQWHYLGTTASPRTTDKNYYDFLWKTSSISDGRYWLNVSVADETQLKSWDIINEPIFIHNSKMNAPIIEILTPTHGQHINGTFTLRASAIDFEENIDSMGVIFYYSTDRNDWNVLSNVQFPIEIGSNIYELSWVTTNHKDGKYWLKAEATDFDGFKGESVSDCFFIHNSLKNPPIVIFLSPNSGEFSGSIKINATAFDLEENINEVGVNFYCSIDNKTWNIIGNDPLGSIMEDEKLYYEITWDTNLVPDDFYWLSVEAKDLTDLIGTGISDEKILIHNKLTNPPRIIFKQPRKNVPLSRIQPIIVDVIDFDDDVESVAFYYSTDNQSWKLIDTLYKPGKDITYNIMWETREMDNGYYYIKVKATDKMGNQAELTEGTFEITEGKERIENSEENFLFSALSWAIIIIILILIIILIIFSFHKRITRREKELIEEVSAELREARTLEGEVVNTPGGVVADSYSYQSYVPPSQSLASGMAEISTEEREMKDLEVNLGIVAPVIASVPQRPGEASALGTIPQTPGTTPELPPIDEI